MHTLRVVIHSRGDEMFWTYDRYQPAQQAARWGRHAERTRRGGDQLGKFLLSVDRMLFVASAAFVACVVAILIG